MTMSEYWTQAMCEFHRRAFGVVNNSGGIVIMTHADRIEVHDAEPVLVWLSEMDDRYGDDT